MSALPKVTIYSDGAYSRKYNAGGWASYLTYNEYDLVLCDYVQDTTNNRMELQAVLSSLQQLTCRCNVEVYSDSQYVVNGINQWLSGWARRNWVSSTGSAVMNRDLWELMLQYKQFHRIKAFWVRGHDGHPENELCDEVALAIQRIRGGYVRSGG